VKVRIRLSNFSPLILILSLSSQVDAQHSRRNKVVRSFPSLPQIRLLTGKASLKIPFKSASNLILLQARVNDSAPFWFIVDTAATNTVIDTELAKTLGLKSLSRRIESGGAGTATALIFKNNSLRLPNIEVTNLTLYGLPINFLSAPLGRTISGVIGNDVLKQLVVEVDYTSQVINLYQPEGFQYSGAGAVIPIIFEGHPFVRAGITVDDGHVIEGKFGIDSGANNAIIFNTPFVDRNRLLQSVSKSKEMRAVGVGGSAVAFSSRLKSMTLGSLQLENIIAQFSRAQHGETASARYDGLIGGEILRRFKVTFDYRRRRMMLEPNADFAEPYEADMSGLDLLTEGGDFSVVVVNQVEKGSAAADAGMQDEDIITAIDGRPATDFTITEIRNMFMQDCKEYLISLMRRGKQLQTKLKLRRLI
jgi:hypothetical protein